jgi:hypothetical protein
MYRRDEVNVTFLVVLRGDYLAPDRVPKLTGSHGLPPWLYLPPLQLLRKRSLKLQKASPQRKPAVVANVEKNRKKLAHLR